MALERFGEVADPSLFELHYRQTSSGSLARLLSNSSNHILADDESPVLVSEWYSEDARRWGEGERGRGREREEERKIG